MSSFFLGLRPFFRPKQYRQTISLASIGTLHLGQRSGLTCSSPTRIIWLCPKAHDTAGTALGPCKEGTSSGDETSSTTPGVPSCLQ